VEESFKDQLKIAILAFVTDAVLPRVMENAGEKLHPGFLGKEAEKVIKKVSAGNHINQLPQRGCLYGLLLPKRVSLMELSLETGVKER
jgi:hypothetical protein